MRSRLVCASLLAALVAGSRPAAQPASSLAIEDVSVIPMDRERVLTEQTVLVRDGRIAAIAAAASTSVPPGATRIDGRGRFLIPALAEMHAHIPGGGAVAEAERVLFMYVANGIGTIRSMLGDPGHLQLIESARRGEIVATTMYLSGPSLNGQTAPTPDAATARVIEQKNAGYDLLKIHPGVPRGGFDALAAAAGRQNIRFAGHVPADVGLARALEAKYWTIDHLDGYVEALARRGAPAGQLFGINLTGHVDETRIPALVEQTRAAGTWIVPTQILLENWYGPDDPETMRGWPEMRYASPAEIKQWTALDRSMKFRGRGTDRRGRSMGLHETVLHAGRTARHPRTPAGL